MIGNVYALQTSLIPAIVKFAHHIYIGSDMSCHIIPYFIKRVQEFCK